MEKAVVSSSVHILKIIDYNKVLYCRVEMYENNHYIEPIENQNSNIGQSKLCRVK